MHLRQVHNDMIFTEFFCQLIMFIGLFDHPLCRFDDRLGRNTLSTDVFDAPWVDLELDPLVQVARVYAVEYVAGLLQFLYTRNR